MLNKKKLRKISIIGTGLLGASISQGLLRAFPTVIVSAYSHRASTRRRARQLGVATEVVDDLGRCVADSDIVIVATPIRTFEAIFKAISGCLKSGCIVTDVGSTKVLAHRWAKKVFGKNVFYVGSHPVAGSEKRGIDFARDDLLTGAACILTRDRNAHPQAVNTLKKLWTALGCRVHVTSPAEHDRILGMVSHLPHVAAVALVNAGNRQDMRLAGRGFIDTSRVASGPVNIWTDILLTNRKNTTKGIDRMVGELYKLRKAILAADENMIERLLRKAGDKRKKLIDYKVRHRELL